MVGNMKHDSMNDLNLIIGIVEGTVTTTETFNTLSVYLDPADRGRKYTRRALMPGVKTVNSAEVIWQE